MVCYTNHALDQFLAKVTGFTNSIIRIGGYSRNAQFIRYLLKNRIKGLVNTERDKEHRRLE